MRYSCCRKRKRDRSLKILRHWYYLFIVTFVSMVLTCLNHRQHRKPVGSSARAKTIYYRYPSKKRKREKEREKGKESSDRVQGPWWTFVFISRHPFPVLILRYTCNLPHSTRPIVGHMCVSSREVCLCWPI